MTPCAGDYLNQRPGGILHPDAHVFNQCLKKKKKKEVNAVLKSYYPFRTKIMFCGVCQ